MYAYFGQGSGGIFLDQVRCAGTESSLISCLSSGIGVHTCGHSQDAGVRCQGSIIYACISISAVKLLAKSIRDSSY